MPDINDVRRIMLNVVKNLADPMQKNSANDDEIIDKKRNINKNALIILKQQGYGSDNNLKYAILEELNKYLWGYYVLDELINDPQVTDIRVSDYNYIRYKKLGKRYQSGERFLDRNDYIQYINTLAVRNKKSLSDVNAITYFTDDSNENNILRFNICTSLICSESVPVLTIRKISKEKNTLNELIGKKMLDERVANYLVDKARNASGMLFTGKGASGKTTLMNTLIEHIDENESAVVIQENDELFVTKRRDSNGEWIPSRDIVFLHTITASGDGKTSYSLSDLTRNGLRMDIDYYIIGEIKGDEAVGFSMASFTGHKCWATVHGMNSYEGINKLADYIKQATGYTFEDCLRKLIGIEIVIFMKDYKINEITEISGFDDCSKDLIKRVVYKEGIWY